MKYVTEILEEVNKDTSKLEQYKNNMLVKMLFEYAFIPEKKFDLPEGAPPFKDDAAPIGMSPGNFLQEVRRFYVFTKQRELPKIRREQLFLQLLENIHPSEAKVLLAIKDQNLNSLYPNINSKVLAQYGLIPEQKETNDGDTTPKKS
jgi:hypothetical protein